MKRLRKKLLKKYRGKTYIIISHKGEGFSGFSNSCRDIDSVEVSRDTTGGKNLITVKINKELVFSFDSNFVGEYYMENDIQKPLK